MVIPELQSNTDSRHQDSVMNLLLKAVQECVNHMDDLERFFILSLVELSFERYSAKRDNKTVFHSLCK